VNSKGGKNSMARKTLKPWQRRGKNKNEEEKRKVILGGRKKKSGEKETTGGSQLSLGVALENLPQVKDGPSRRNGGKRSENGIIKHLLGEGSDNCKELQRDCPQKSGNARKAMGLKNGVARCRQEKGTPSCFIGGGNKRGWVQD